MYRKLVFVVAMFAVAIGSLSQAQAALASPRSPARVASAAHAWTTASIATHSATGAVRAAAATRPMAHSARLRTEERQGSLPLGGGRRATETASAPTITAPKITSAGQVPNQACPFTSLALTTFTVGQPGTFTVTSTGVPNCTFSETGALPSGVTFADDGTLSGTPAAGTGGTYPVTITATNVDGYDTQSFTLTVNQPCQITSSAATTFNTGLAGSFTVTSTGLPTCALSETAASAVSAQGGLPSGVKFTDNGDGTATLSGTPAAGTGGTYTLTITATNSSGPVTQTFTLTVNTSQACAITTAGGATFTAGQAGTFTVTSTGTPTCALSETVALPMTGLPSGVTFTDNGDGTATLSGTPAAGSGGTYTLTITATNGVSPAATQTFTLQVLQACQITSAAADTFTTGLAGTFAVTSTGVPNCTWSETGALPSGVKFTDNGDGTATLSGTPAAGTGGTYPVTITATNGVSPDATQSFTLTVNQPCQITSPATATLIAGQPGTVTVTSTGFPTCTWSGIGHLPRGLTGTDNGDGTATISGTPAAGSGGVYLFRITATNVAGSYGQLFTLIVFQRPQITSADHTTCIVGEACAFTVRSTGVPTPDLLEKGALPSGVTFTDNGDGTATLSGTPAAGTAGTYTLTIGAINIASPYATHVIPDTNLLSLGAVQTFTLTVVGPPAAPSGLKATGKGRTVTLTWANHAKPPSAATVIEIQRSTNAKFTTAVTNTTVGPTVTSHKNTVVAGKRYYYRVRAYNAAGFSLWSNVASG